MRTLLTPRQVARAIGVSDASMKRWCDKGLLPVVRTAGGHRRLALDNVIQFLRRSGHELVRPEVLGLPPTTGKGDATIERARCRLRDALIAGDVESFVQFVLNLFLAGHSACDICDRAVAPAFHDIGTRWQHGQLEVYEERRGVQVCKCGLHQLGQVLPSIPVDAPHAIGATLEGDAYALPSTMVALALREAGWRAEFYGCGHPFSTLRAAIRNVRPRLFWLSVSHIASMSDFLESYPLLYREAVECHVAFAVGGRALTEELRHRIEYSAYCDNLRHLVSFAATLYPHGRADSAQPQAS